MCPHSILPHLYCKLVLREVNALVLLELSHEELEDRVVKVLS
jgi:uncharacterized protein (DUF952 family)